MLGVTGTDGKTTTASLIHSILLAAGLRAGLISTVSAVIGDETLDTGFHVTTPDAPAIQGYLARMVAAGLTHCVLEVTSHGRMTLSWARSAGQIGIYRPCTERTMHRLHPARVTLPSVAAYSTTAASDSKRSQAPSTANFGGLRPWNRTVSSI